MDGGSTDGSLAIIENAAERARAEPGCELLWRSERDGGQTDAINRGMRLATGEIVGYLNSDDRYLPGALATVAEAFATHPRAQWLTGYCRIIDEHDRPMHQGVRRYKNAWLRRFSRQSLLVLNYVAQPATFWRRSAAAELGELDDGLHYCMDYDYWLRLAARGKPLVVRRHLAEYRVHPASKGGSAYRDQFREDLEVARRHTSNRTLLLLHRLHNGLIVACYGFLK
jgi:glycosyltransferase involved in cell wall biosynthesis